MLGIEATLTSSPNPCFVKLAFPSYTEHCIVQSDYIKCNLQHVPLIFSPVPYLTLAGPSPFRISSSCSIPVRYPPFFTRFLPAME